MPSSWWTTNSRSARCTTGCSGHSSSIWDAAYTPASTSSWKPSTSAPVALPKRWICWNTRTSPTARPGRRNASATAPRTPFNIRMWCLGNEMDGPWQTGHKSAEDYGKLAASVAAGMRMIDPDLELVVCGSSSHTMDTFGKWEETVLEHTFDKVNFVFGHHHLRRQGVQVPHHQGFRSRRHRHHPPGARTQPVPFDRREHLHRQ